MQFKHPLTSGMVCLVLFAGMCYGQGVGTSGDIAGTVVDPAGAVVENASVIAVEAARGIQHTARTDSTGHYRFSGLPPAIYELTAQGGGFASELHKNVTVILGETTIV